MRNKETLWIGIAGVWLGFTGLYLDTDFLQRLRTLMRDCWWILSFFIGMYFIADYLSKKPKGGG